MSNNSGASFKVNIDGLKKTFKRFDPVVIERAANELAMSKGFAALVGQAIADNFEKEGPDWKPLSAQTLRSSVTEARKQASKRTGEPTRKILQKSGLLMKSATTPGAKGNIFRVRGSEVEWGTNLIYAGIHNRGGTINNPGTKNGFGMGIEIPAHKITIPARPYLRLSAYWKAELSTWAIAKFIKLIARGK